MVNDDEECPFLLSYEKFFEICFYCGLMCSEKHSCPTDFDNDGCLLMDRIFEDESVICPENFLVSDQTKNDLQDKGYAVVSSPYIDGQVWSFGK